MPNQKQSDPEKETLSTLTTGGKQSSRKRTSKAKTVAVDETQVRCEQTAVTDQKRTAKRQGYRGKIPLVKLLEVFLRFRDVDFKTLEVCLKEYLKKLTDLGL